MMGTFILTAAALITKILSAVYRIPFQNIVGDIGFYIYQQVYPFYGIALALSTYGFPVIISKMIAEQQEEKNEKGVRAVIHSSFLFLGVTGILWFLLIYFSAGSIASLMGDPHLEVLIELISVTFLLLPFISGLRGFYQGTGNMIPTAYSQVGEQLVRVITIISFSAVLTAKGYSLYMAGAGALFGSLTGGLICILILLAFVWRDNTRMFFPVRLMANHKEIWLRLLKHGTAICVSGMLLVLLQLIDALNVYSLLLKSGVSDDVAKQLKGIYDRGQPFIQLGTVVSTSLSLTLVPLITTAFRKGDKLEMNEKIRLALKIGSLAGFAAALGLINIIEPTNKMLFQNSLGSDVIAVFCISILFSSIILTVSGILQGMELIYFPALTILGGLAVKFMLNILFVSRYGTMGASVSTVIALAVMTIVLVIRLRKQFTFLFLSRRFYIVAGTAGLGMTAFLQLYFFLFEMLASESTRLLATIQSLTGTAAGGAIFILIIIKGNVFTPKELEQLPMGNKLKSVSERIN
ncbi:polysaccharide biosynthesis protein [Bacillus salacetis]|uniref:Polysaccharide biosynthesis protein n=1 Tax=Bacillus salacetis TaxID=2315464 RepID=A0A3A1QVG3_9BACI|nr:polysaccharide biosynthesis protein [Bacillus salacetis]RIW29896.1 polysaccharide biosynthesis protein [Bacillus salacetis]